jgi:hypothetical protein
MGLYRKLPIIIEAIQFTDKTKDRVLLQVKEWQRNVQHGQDEIWYLAESFWDKDDNPAILIPTLEGEMLATLGDWIIKGVNGEVYPCKDDIFKKTYELVEE